MAGDADLMMAAMGIVDLAPMAARLAAAESGLSALRARTDALANQIDAMTSRDAPSSGIALITPGTTRSPRCGECPFYYVDAGAYCTVGADGRERRITAEEMLDGEHDVPPDWCPRRKGAVVVPMFRRGE